LVARIAFGKPCCRIRNANFEHVDVFLDLYVEAVVVVFSRACRQRSSLQCAFSNNLMILLPDLGTFSSRALVPWSA
jgi:hypothetical protein